MGKKKNAPAGAAAGTSSSKVIDNLKTLNFHLVDQLAEHRKQIEQLRSQPDSLTTDRDIADSIERQIKNSTSPKLWTENWTEWLKAWDKPDPHTLAKDLAYSVARFFQSSGTLQNYYMYHGGTFFGRTTEGPYITTTYDYDAPIDEYGNIQPNWGHLKGLHAVIKKMEKALTYENAKATELDNGLSVTKFFDSGVVPGCFLANKNTTDDATSDFDVTLDFEGTKFFLPAWSLSILLGCKQEVYNTAKINAQTSIMVKKPNEAEAEPKSLIWSWKPEDLSKTVQGLEPDFTTNTLRDQILASVDASDYLWYITRWGLMGRSNKFVLTTLIHPGTQVACFQRRFLSLVQGKISIRDNSNIKPLSHYMRYHDPRSFLMAVEPNTLALFEEAGIDPSQVNFQIVTVGTVCATVVEGKILTWSCRGPQKIFALQVASSGDLQEYL